MSLESQIAQVREMQNAVAAIMQKMSNADWLLPSDENFEFARVGIAQMRAFLREARERSGAQVACGGVPATRAVFDRADAAEQVIEYLTSKCAEWDAIQQYSDEIARNAAEIQHLDVSLMAARAIGDCVEAEMSEIYSMACQN